MRNDTETKTMMNLYTEQILTESIALSFINAQKTPYRFNLLFNLIRGPNDTTPSLYVTYINFLRKYDEYLSLPPETDNLAKIEKMNEVKGEFQKFLDNCKLNIPTIIENLKILLFQDVNGVSGYEVLRKASSRQQADTLKTMLTFFDEFKKLTENIQKSLQTHGATSTDITLPVLEKKFYDFVVEVNRISAEMNQVLGIKYHGNLFNKFSGFLRDFLDFKQLM